MSLKILQLDFAKFGFVPFCFFVHEIKKRYLLANLGLAKPWKWRNVTWKKGTILKRMVNHLRNHHFFLGEKMWNGLLKKYVKLYFYRLPCLKVQPEGLPTWISQQGSLYYQAKQCISKKGNPWKTTIDSSKFDFPPPQKGPTHFFWSHREVSLHHAERRAVPLPSSLAKRLDLWMTLHPPRMPVENESQT